MTRSQAIVGALVLVFGLAGAARAQVAYGINFNFEVDTSMVATCAAGERGAATRDRGRLSHYEQPEIRARAQSDLRTLTRRGIRWVRSIVWFGGTGQRNSNHFMVPQDTERAAREVAMLGDDLVQAGVTDWIIAFGSQGRFSPKCRSMQWGDCYHQDTTAPTIDFIRSVRHSLNATRHPRLWVDIANEACLASGSPELIRQSNPAYVRALVSAYAAEFPGDRITVSCIGTRIPERLASVDTMFGARKPDFYDVHIYNGMPHHNAAAAAEFAAGLKARGRPGIIGETTMNDFAFADAMTAAMSAAGGPLPLSILYWPKRIGAGPCIADTPESEAATR